MAAGDGGASRADAKRHLTNWHDEVDSAALYRALADLEGDPALADVYRRLAAAEDRHAGFWADRLQGAAARASRAAAADRGRAALRHARGR